MTRGLAVVSGGATGIGAAIAEGLAEDGYDILIVGRRAELLHEAARRIGVDCGRLEAIEAVSADLTDPVQATQVAEAVGERTVDVVGTSTLVRRESL